MVYIHQQKFQLSCLFLYFDFISKNSKVQFVVWRDNENKSIEIFKLSYLSLFKFNLSCNFVIYDIKVFFE